MKKILAVILSAFIASHAFAQDATVTSDVVKKFVENIGNKIVGIAGEKGSTESKKKDKIITTIDEVIDTDWIAKFVLGKNYKTLDDKQKEGFLKLYRDFMINTYGPKFKDYNGRKFTVNEVTQQGNFYIAKAEFLPRDSDVAVSVNFRVKERGGKLVILDFVAEGVSLIETQRSEFNSAISQKGLDKFLDDLSTRVLKLKGNS